MTNLGVLDSCLTRNKNIKFTRTQALTSLSILLPYYFMKVVTITCSHSTMQRLYVRPIVNIFFSFWTYNTRKIMNRRYRLQINQMRCIEKIELYNMIPDAIFTCAQKLKYVSLISCTEPNTKK